MNATCVGLRKRSSAALLTAGLLLPLLLGSCGEKPSIVGKWRGSYKGNPLWAVFRKDGTGLGKWVDATPESFRYTIRYDKSPIWLDVRSRSRYLPESVNRSIVEFESQDKLRLAEIVTGKRPRGFADKRAGFACVTLRRVKN